MKNRIFVILLFVPLVLVLSGSAQQASSSEPAVSSSQASSPSQSAETTDREPLRPPTSPDFWDGDDPNLINLVTHPFANKKYVQRMTGPIRDRINELDQLTAEQSKTIKEVDARSQQGLQSVSERTNLADQQATDAGNKADVAKLAATEATGRVSTLQQRVGNLDQYKGSAQTEIRFRPGQIILSKQGKDALDQMAAPLKDQHGYILEVRAFASGRGQAAIGTSQKMADSVVHYLVLNHQIPVYRIFAQGMGNAPNAAQATKTAHTGGGRVEIDVLTNDALTPARH